MAKARKSHAGKVHVKAAHGRKGYWRSKPHKHRR